MTNSYPPSSQTAARCPRPFWILLPVLLAGIATTSQALPGGSATTDVRVHYKTQELTTPLAARTLFRRIGEAALESCGASSFSLVEVKTATERGSCWRRAVEAAVRQIDNPLLDAVANEHQR